MKKWYLYFEGKYGVIDTSIPFFQYDTIEQAKAAAQRFDKEIVWQQPTIIENMFGKFIEIKGQGKLRGQILISQYWY